MKTKYKVIIDLEFTGLDNTYINDNEIIQVKMMMIDDDIKEDKTVIKTYGSKKKNTAGSYVVNRIDNSNIDVMFSNDEFNKLLLDLIPDYKEQETNIDFFGYSVELDIKMLKKYDILININDIKRDFQLSEEYGEKMALEGSSMESVCYMCGEESLLLKDHGGIDELIAIRALYNISQKELSTTGLPTRMLFGHCAGMPIEEYCEKYRRAADGYRFNNNDDLSQALDCAIDILDFYDDGDHELFY